MANYKAYRIFNENNKIEGRLVDVPEADIGRGDVVFKTAYSSVNFKDALAATGAGGKIIRKFPLIGGIDAAGTVVSFDRRRASRPATRSSAPVMTWVWRMTAGSAKSAVCRRIG